MIHCQNIKNLKNHLCNIAGDICLRNFESALFMPRYNKKWLLFIIISLSVIIGYLYAFIPDSVTLKSNINIKATRQGVYRMLLNEESLNKWWPGNVNKASAKNIFLLGGYSYKIGNNNISLLPVTITGNRSQLNTSLYLIPLQRNVVLLQWIGESSTSYNPFKRFLAFREAKKINRDMDTILQKMGSFLSQPKNIYEHEVHHLLIVDSTFISTIDTISSYPSTAFIYNRVNKLRSYANAHSVMISGYPMLNVDALDSIHYIVRVAVPLPKSLPSSGDIYEKRMPVNVSILMMEIKGGANTVSNAFEQMLKYVSDHHQTIPGIPFYSLVTDRSREPDTSKWVTRIYCPVR